jgi:hypothetical protein
MYALGIRGASQINTYTKYPMPGPGIELREDLVSETYMSGGTRIKAERVFVREPN